MGAKIRELRNVAIAMFGGRLEIKVLWTPEHLPFLWIQLSGKDTEVC